MNYNEWIETYVTKHNGFVRGKCKSAVEEMIMDFPELRIAKGMVWCPYPYEEQQHWWCVTTDGIVVDPTVSQFPAVLSYEEHKEGDPIIVGKCLNCGDDIWEPNRDTGEPAYSSSICNASCERSYLAYLNNPNMEY